MAIYKPSNFYPSMDEIDMLESNIFECQVNTDGSKVKAYKINIYSDDGVLLYEDYGNFVNPVGNNEFAQIKIKPYAFIGRGIQDTELFDGQFNHAIQSTEKMVYSALYPYQIKNIQYCPYNLPQLLENDGNLWFCLKELNEDGSSTYYDIINVDGGVKIPPRRGILYMEDSFTPSLSTKEYFICLKNNYNYKWTVRFYEEKIEKENLNNTKIDVTYDNLKFSIILNHLYEIYEYTLPNDDWKLMYNRIDGVVICCPKSSDFDCGYNPNLGFSIQLKNQITVTKHSQVSENIVCDFQVDYPEFYSNKTFVTSGYITGTNNGVIWYNKNDITFNKILDEEKQLDKNELINNYVKENNYIEIRANKNNSYIFDKYIKKHIQTSGLCYSDGEQLICNDADQFLDFSIIDENNRYIILKLDEMNSDLAFIFSDDNIDTYIKPYLSLYRYNNEYIFIEKVTNVYKDLNTNTVVIKIENKQLLSFLNQYYKISKTNFNNYLNKDGEIQTKFTSQDSFFYNEDKSIQWCINGYKSNFLIDGNQSFISGTSDRVVSPATAITVKDSYMNIHLSYLNMIVGNVYDKKITENDKIVNLSFTVDIYNRYFSYYYIPLFQVSALKNPTEILSSEGTYPKYYVLKCKQYWESSNQPIQDVLEGSYDINNSSWRISKVSDETISYGNIVKEKFPSYYDEPLIYDFTISESSENKYDIYYTIKGVKKGLVEGYIKNVTIKNFANRDAFSFIGDSWTTSTGGPIYIRDLKIKTLYNLDNSEIIPCDFSFVQREKIYDYLKNLGTNKDINKIILEKDFKEYLKNKETYYLYSCDNKHTNSSLFVSTNGEIQVGRYIRFPTIDGLVYNEKNFPSTTNITSDIIGKTGYFVHSKYFKPLDNTLKDSMPEESKKLFSKNQNFILYKIIGYDQDTGEVRLENDVYRKLTDTDVYEIWERREESGETTEEYYSRKLPSADNLKMFLKVGGENIATIACKNSNENEIFIQPNINIKSDNFYSPQMIFKNKETIDINFLYDLNEIYDYSLRDKTINKLDNSQWIITTQDTKHPIKCGSEYSIYNAYVDSVPESYFYARNLATINLRYTDKSKYIQNMDVTTIPLIDTDIEEDYCIIKTMNPVFIGEYLGDTSIKRYRYKIYDENNVMILDSQNNYSNDIIFEVNGLNNKCIYKIILEVEDQYGYIYNLENDFKTSFNITYVDYNFNISDAEFGNGLIMYINANEENIGNLSNVTIYKNRNNYLYDYVTTLKIQDENNIINYNGNSVIGKVDYNVGNNIWYDYLFIVGKTCTLNSNYVPIVTYEIVKVSHKACFNRWSIANIIKKRDGSFKVKDIWKIKYNLETGDITNNTSVTKWDTLGKYSQVSIGERGYASSSISCLLGDISQYTVTSQNDIDVKKDGYNEYKSNDKYYSNVQKLNEWQDFCRDGQLKLLQDYKGNKWIVQILENPTHSINIDTQEQITTISFNWSEVMDSTGISIVGEILSNN